MSICFHYTKFRKQFQSAFQGVNCSFRFLSLCGNEECAAMDKKRMVLLGHSMTLLLYLSKSFCSSMFIQSVIFSENYRQGLSTIFSTLQNPWIPSFLPTYKGASKEKKLPAGESFLMSLSEMATHGNR